MALDLCRHYLRHGMFAASQAGRSLGLDNLLAKRLIPGLPDGLAVRALMIAS